jgi:predicted transcriptional regulator
MEASGIIMSIRPEHGCDIMSGRKTVELRRRFPEHVPLGSLV